MKIKNSVAIVTGTSSGIGQTSTKIVKGIQTNDAEIYAHEWMKR